MVEGRVLAVCLFLLLQVTSLQFFGYVIALAGFVWYYISKAQQTAQEAAQPASPVQQEEPAAGEDDVHEKSVIAEV